MPTLDEAMETLEGTEKRSETARHLRRKSTAPVDSLCYGMGSLRAARSIQCTSPCALSAMQARQIQVNGHDQ